MSSDTTLLSSPKYHYVTSCDNTENMSSLPESEYKAMHICTYICMHECMYVHIHVTNYAIY